MTEAMCNQVAERLALGEPLGELSEHAASCASCRGLVSVSGKLAATHHAVDPGLGFSARMTVGAQHLLGVRRRRRLAVGLAATVATGMFGVFIVAHGPDSQSTDRGLAPPTAPTQKLQAERDTEPTTPSADDDLAALAELGDPVHATRESARWKHIVKPLAPYKKLLKGVVP
jgi:hypothetical protein